MLLHFRIQLANITKPPVWRKLVVPGSFSFHRFHKAIQASFGWEDYHLYQFSEKGHASEWVISTPSDDDWQEVKNSRKIKLSELFGTKGQVLLYIYDFGDDWLHKITLEDITQGEAVKAECTDGKGKCPPEDCGGAWGYEALKQTMADPKHPEHREMREWLGLAKGEKWDAAAFDLEETAKEVRTV